MDGFAVKNRFLNLCQVMFWQRSQKIVDFGQKHAVVGINFAFFALWHRKDCNQPAHECNERVSAFVLCENKCLQQDFCGQMCNFFARCAKYSELGAFEIRLCSHCWI